MAINAEDPASSDPFNGPTGARYAGASLTPQGAVEAAFGKYAEGLFASYVSTREANPDNPENWNMSYWSYLEAIKTTGRPPG